MGEQERERERERQREIDNEKRESVKYGKIGRLRDTYNVGIKSWNVDGKMRSIKRKYDIHNKEQEEICVCDKNMML